jgi:hypothetical protein
MLGSPLLGTAVGLILMFATTSLLCSAITESLSNFLQLRAKYLLTGLRAMLDAPETPDRTRKSRTGTLNDRVKSPTAIRDAVAEVGSLGPGDPAPSEPVVTTALFDSPLLKSLQSRRVGVFTTGTLRNPQYLSGRTFTRALVDLLVPAEGQEKTPAVLTIEKVSEAVQALPASLPLRRQLLSFLGRAGDDVDAFEHAVEQWYDEQMAKISGWYKRWARVALGITGLAVAVLANIDTAQVTHSLYADAPLQQAVISTANAGTLCQGETDADARNACATQELATLKVGGLPIGWSSGCGTDLARCLSWSDTAPLHWWDLPLKLVGWGLTAFAVSFGAPFWFEALSKLGSLRNAGTKPEPAE